MKKIRSSVFETNSSSVHAIVWDRKNHNDPIEFVDHLIIRPRRFGVNYEILKTPVDKTTYLAASIQNIYKTYDSIADTDEWYLICKAWMNKTGIRLMYDITDCDTSGLDGHQMDVFEDVWSIKYPDELVSELTRIIFTDRYVIDIMSEDMAEEEGLL